MTDAATFNFLSSRPASADGFALGMWIGGHTTDEVSGINTWDGKIDDLTIWRETRYTSAFTIPKIPVYYNY